MPTRHLGSSAKKATSLPRRIGLLTTTFPAASTAWTCITFLARSSPTVVTVSSLLIDLRMDGFPVDGVSQRSPSWHNRCRKGRRPPHHRYPRTQGPPYRG